MSRQSTGELPDDEPSPRRLAADVPRGWAGEQHHPAPDGEILDPQPHADHDEIVARSTLQDRSHKKES